MGGNCGLRLESEVHGNRFNYTMMESERLLYSKHDFDRIGTKPFMPVELLAGRRGSVLRKCYHDLESMVWCFVWYCKEVEEWKYSECGVVANSKVSWAINHPYTVPEDAREGVANLWGPTWSIVRQIAYSLSDPVTRPTHRALLDLINTHIPYSPRPDKKEWDSKWKE